MRRTSDQLLNFKIAIAARRTTQVDLAMEVRIPPSVLSEIIRGRRKAAPALRTKLATLLRMDEDWLFEATKIPSPPRSHARDEHVEA